MAGSVLIPLKNIIITSEKPKFNREVFSFHARKVLLCIAAIKLQKFHH